ncbi:ABC transporter substrate-binding protein [Tabrizicola sp.]|uniref:ABC transporter substrate-binding protein n=1 Tax=Tabrizicola sp. TaxID=2005166 RepID=UPI0025E626EF|nr:ABC transporter substrate-binding protein [Tabrizicola sp.]MBY0350456.1 ABC transporter substrate-binding protein [Tabrizicola sp.]
MKLAAVLCASVALPMTAVAQGVELEVTHWWTSGGEAAAVAEFAKAFNATGNTWVDGAIAGSGDVARPIIISRILGGNPMGATQLNPGKDADDLIAAGLMQDLTELATKEDWANILRPKSQLESCTKDGKVYCVPVNLHSGQWMWTNRKVYEDLGIAPPQNWAEMVAAAPKLKEAGIIPLSLAEGWPIGLLTEDLIVAIAGVDNYVAVYQDRNMQIARGPEFAAVFKAIDEARQIIDPKTVVPQWNDAVALVIQGKAGANVMGDWAGGEFAVAGLVAGKDFDCLPGLGVEPVLGTGGDVFYFPKSDDPEVTKAQMTLASTMVTKEVQVAFNLKKGSLPMRADVDLSAANDCMKKGLEILDRGTKVFPNNSQMLDRDSLNQINDVMKEFFSDLSITPEQAQEQFAAIIEAAPK